MGEVYRARDAKLNRDVAVKTLPQGVAADPSLYARFEREARVIASLSHPNVLAIYDFGQTDGTTYLAMELLEGETLRQRLASGALPTRKAVEIAAQIARGLAAAHEKGIAHRDLKPENVIVGRDGHVKILDFGLARQRDAPAADDTRSPTIARPTDPGTLLGTAGYMSPEQVRCEPADHRSDIFSLGCVLYEMLTGRRAFQEATAVQTMNAILTADPPEIASVVPGVPESLARVVAHCLEKSPDERFQSARDVAFDLQSLSTLSREPPPPGSLSAGARPARGRGARTAAFLAVAALSGALGYFAASRLSRSPSPVFTQLTFRRGFVTSAHFTPDGRTVVYGAAWEGTPIQSYSTRIGGQESAPLGLPAGDVLSVSASGELLLSLGRRYTQGYETTGRLARVPLTGGAPREILESVMEASFTAGEKLLVVREAGDRCRLELGGRLLYESTGWIQGPSLSPRGDLVAFVEHPFRRADNGMVCVIPAAGGAKKLLTPELSAVQGLAWVRGEVWYTGTRSGARKTLNAVTLAGRERLVLRAPVDLQLLDADAAGRCLLSGSHMRMGTIYRTHGTAEEREVSWLDYSFGMSLTPDGETVVLNEMGEGTGPRYGIYVRRVDGSPAARLGDGYKGVLSPDGRWVLTETQDDPQRIVLLPMGAGEARSLPPAGFRYQALAWFPDGKRIAFSASAPKGGVRLYAQDLDGGTPKPFTAEGVGLSTPWLAISPDGKFAVATGHDERPFLFPTDGGAPVALPWLAPGDAPQRFSPDGRVLYCMRSGMTAGEIVRAELDTRTRSVWESIRPADPAGVSNVRPSDITPDGRHHVYIYVRTMSDVFLVEGLR
jgi:serine/threonine protein kinase